jgi:hypothetical protein
MSQDYELVEVEKHVSAASVRRRYNRMNLDPLDKIMEKYDASGVRWYYNQKNLRKRKGGEINGK